MQRLITVGGADYINFFFTPGSIDSLHQFISRGWIVKHIKDDGSTAVILFEK
jgi:hypothetical protein